MQTKTLSNLELEFPALEKSKGKALKGGSGTGYWDTRTGLWVESTNGWNNGGNSVNIPGVTVTPGSNYPAGGTSPYPYNGGGGYGNNSGGGGGGGGYSGGGDTGGGSGVNDPFRTHHIFSPSLPPNNGSETQLSNHCLFKAMEVANHYNGGNVNYGQFLGDYVNFSGNVNAIRDGFSGSEVQLKSFLNNYFDTNPLSTYPAIVAALDNNHAVLGTIYSGNGIYHEIVLTGYDVLNGNLKFTYFDPATGFYVYGAPYDTVFQSIEITGNK